jgi:hypothetical protein
MQLQQLLYLSYHSSGLSFRVVSCDRVVIITKLLYSGVEALQHLLIMIYSDVRVTKLLLLYHARIITTSSMAYSGADASEHLLIIINGKNLLYQRKLEQVFSLQSEQPSISSYHRLSI